MEEKIKQLETQINELTQWKNSMSSFLPPDLDNALLIKGYLKSDKPNLPPAGYDTNAGFIRVIDLDPVPASLDIPAYPIRYLRLNPPNQDFYVPLFAFSQLGI